MSDADTIFALSSGQPPAGIAVVRSYGSSETAGGCVYDGVPLDGVFVRVDGASADGVGRIAIGGATLAKGYRNPPDPDPFAELENVLAASAAKRHPAAPVEIAPVEAPVAS